MSISTHMKETAEDIATKDRLWASTERELTYFAEKLAAMGPRPEKGDTKEQAELIGAVELKGYPVTVVRELAATMRALQRTKAAKKPREGREQQLHAKVRQRITDYRHHIGLGHMG